MAARSLSTSGLRIIVMGFIVRGPVGGLTWHHVQYLGGLAALGHSVYFLEDSDDYPGCYDPSRHVTDTDASYGLRYTADVLSRLGFGQRWAYHDAHARQWRGPCADTMQSLCAEADLLLNISGVNPLRPWVASIPARVLVDTDPVFTHVRRLENPAEHEYASGHTAFFSFGENFGQAGCGIPDDGLAWKPTRQPVMLDYWPVAPPLPDGAFTSVLQWDSYAEAEYHGVRYGMKSVSFPEIADVPSRVRAKLELALGGEGAPRGELASRGWVIRDPAPISRDPWTYQNYIRESAAEFGIAKHGYVVARSGWFSERSAVYLASGRPVVAQETGYSTWLGNVDGVLPFRDSDDAVAAIAEVQTNYKRHCRGARNVAEAFFDARKVLQRLIEDAMK